MKVSSIYGKRILSTSGKCGYVISVNAGEQSIFFVCADDNEKEFCVDMASVISVGDKIIYDGTECVSQNAVPLRLGRAGFDIQGNYLGKLEDFTVMGKQLKTAKIGKKNYPVEGLIFGDVIIVKNVRRLNCDVVKNGNTLFKKGTVVTDGVLAEAAAAGEYVQTTLKSL